MLANNNGAWRGRVFDNNCRVVIGHGEKCRSHRQTRRCCVTREMKDDKKKTEETHDKTTIKPSARRKLDLLSASVIPRRGFGWGANRMFGFFFFPLFWFSGRRSNRRSKNSSCAAPVFGRIGNNYWYLIKIAREQQRVLGSVRFRVPSSWLHDLIIVFVTRPSVRV